MARGVIVGYLIKILSGRPQFIENREDTIVEKNQLLPVNQIFPSPQLAPHSLNLCL